MAFSFPRGGSEKASSSAGAPKRTLTEESLFGNKRTKRIEVVQTKKKGDAKIQAVKTSNLLGGIGLGMTKTVGNSSQVKIDPISIGKLNVGCCVLGYVLQITEKSVIVSLPGGLTGTVAKHEVSDIIYKIAVEEQEQRRAKNFKSNVPEPSSVLKLYQCVRCYVLEQTQKSDNNKRKIINLSLRASLINKGLALKHLSEGFPVYGCVVSQEDTGYVVEAGISGVNFFLPEKAMPTSFGTLAVGQPIEGVIAKLSEGARAATLRAHPKAVYEAMTSSSSLTFAALCPGMRVNVVVDKVVENGLLVSFMTMFHGVIDTASLSRPFRGNTWNQSISAGDVVQARIVLIDHGNKSVRLSLRPHVMEMRCIKNLPALGSLVEGLSVANVLKKVGVVLTDATVAASAEEDGSGAAVVEGEEPKKKSKKDIAEAEKRKKEQDEAVLGCFISRHSLSATGPSQAEDTDDDATAADDEDDDEEADKARRSKAKRKAAEAQLDEKINVDGIPRVYKLGASVSAVKVLGYNLVEGWFVGTNLTDSLTVGQVTHSSDVQVGQVLNVEITGIRDFGLVVRIGRKVSAVCPIFHSADVVGVGKLHKKFKVGQKMNMRVWEVDGSSIIMTNKKTIIELPKPKVITSYSDVEVGRVATGIVAKIDADGLLVRFFNKVKGVVPNSVLAKQGVLNPAEEYREGQSISVVFIRKALPQPGAKKNGKSTGEGASNSPVIFLGLDLSSDTSSIVALISDKDPLLKDMISESSTSKTFVSEASTSAALVPVEANAGKNTNTLEIVSGSVIKIDDSNTVHIRLDDGRLAKAHYHQLYDFAETADAVFAQKTEASFPFATGARIERLLTLSEGKNSMVNVTAKPLLLAAADSVNARAAGAGLSSASTTSEHLSNASADDISIPCAGSDLIPGQTVAGYISKVEAFGVFIAFRNNLSALAPRVNIADRFVPTPVGLYSPGDSVRCVVQRVDLAKERVLVTLKPSIVSPSAGSLCFLKSLLRERFIASSNNLIGSDKMMPSWQSYPIGSVTKVTVSAVEDYGTIFMAKDGTTIMIDKSLPSQKKSKKSSSSSSSSSKRPAVGDEVEVFVTDVNFEECVLEVSVYLAATVAPQTTTSSEKKKKSSKTKSSTTTTTTGLSVGTICSGSVLKIETNYLLVSVNHGAAVVYVSLVDYHCPKTDSAAEATKFEVGGDVSVKVMCSGNNRSQVVHFPHQGQTFAVVAHQDSSRNTAARMQREAEQSDAALRERLSNAPGTAGDAPDSASGLVMKQKFIDSMRVGYLTKWIITDISAHEVLVQPEFSSVLGLNIKAVVHLTGGISARNSHDNLMSSLRSASEPKSSDALPVGHPFANLKTGNKMWCYVLQVRRETSNNKDNFIIYLAMTSPVGGGATAEDVAVPAAQPRGRQRSDSSVSETADPPKQKEQFSQMLQAHGRNEIKCPSICAVVVTKVDSPNITVAFSPYISGTINVMDISTDKNVIDLFLKKAFIGLRLIVAVTDITKENNRIRNLKLSRVAVEKLVENDAPSFDLTRSNKEVSKLQSQPTYKAGDVVSAMVNLHNLRVPRQPAVSLSVCGHVNARVCVTELAEHEDWVDLSPFYRALKKKKSDEDDSDDDSSDGEEADKGCIGGLFRHGEIVQARVLSVGNKGLMEMSLRPSRVQATKTSVALKEDPLPVEGSVVQAYVANASTKGCFLRLSSSVTGQVLMKDISDSYVSDPASEFPVGKLVSARLMSVNQADSTAKLSLKTSVIVGNAKKEAEIEKINTGDTVSGVVEQVTAMGVFVAIDNTSLVGLSRRAHAVSDEQKLPSEEFSVGDVVRAKVLSVSRGSQKIALGLKEHYFRKDGIEDDDTEEEEEEESEVEESLESDEEEEDSEIEDSEEDEEEESSEDDDDDNEDDDEEEEDDEEEDLIQAKLLDGSDFDSDDDELKAMIKAASLPYDESSDEQQEEEEEEVTKPSKKAKKADKKENKREMVESSGDEGVEEDDVEVARKSSKQSKSRRTSKQQSDSDSNDDEDGSANIFGASSSVPAKRSKTVSASSGAAAGLMWDDFAPAVSNSANNAGGDSESSSDGDDESDAGSDDAADGSRGSNKLRSRQKEALKRKAEAEIRSKEAHLLDDSATPQSKQDFERLLIAQPNSSYLWIQFMAFYLQSADIENARVIASRALRTIGFREEEEKFNVWVALLNMEHRYGNTQTLESNFAKAVAESKGKLIFMALADIYNSAGDVAGAEAVFAKALKRPQYKKSKKMWGAYLLHKLRSGDGKGTKEQLTRALQCLSRHKHVELISKHALAEFDEGSEDRGRVLFEELLNSYPKRTDIWHLYIDKETKLQNIEQTRHLYNRMVCAKISSRNVKVAFKKWLGFELKYGDEEAQESVKSKARDYVSTVTSSSA